VSWLANSANELGSPGRIQLRLESDTDAVQIVTIHKAKGLGALLLFSARCGHPLTQTGGMSSSFTIDITAID
jgi:ATP-dependent exoDNAse (exonuclease V) beta subunit